MNRNKFKQIYVKAYKYNIRVKLELLSTILVNKIRRKSRHTTDPTKLAEESEAYIRQMMIQAFLAGYRECLSEQNIKHVKLRTDAEEVIKFEMREDGERVTMSPIHNAYERVIDHGNCVIVSPTMIREIHRDFSLEELVYLRDECKCVYCGDPGDTVDHVIPVSKGGTNGMKNMVTSCRKCNQDKRDNILEVHPLEAEV